ncbi:hypothetical protein PROFUN_04026 [Planoprotostelium fungivorum]|uniref:Uncharacterized protein n=1 Tax=Planoprotostelium fungivorum TaxID=1890364 RepID=A0A2P6NW65_9EUKA|nr:hypothetical protein PROFUN_04026 [Planoprotostelium fungivorum]
MVSVRLLSDVCVRVAEGSWKAQRASPIGKRQELVIIEQNVQVLRSLGSLSLIDSTSLIMVVFL